MNTVILFISYILISMVFTWKFVDFIKSRQWDIKSARLLLGIFIFIIGLLLLSVRVAILGGIDNYEAYKNEIALTLIFGVIIMFVVTTLSLWVMYLVRKMKYMEVTFNIPGNNSENGSLSESKMTCLVDRDQVLNVEKVFTTIDSKRKLVHRDVDLIEKD
ncbi:MAG: hypothetical protein JXQ66_03635 [Campylobacterales bacterium]|nr:hypothetical protein [Campylobacterales bacterium]